MISAANVKQALALYGAESLNKRDHFARLLSEIDFESDGDEEDMEEQEQDGADKSRSAPEGEEDADDTGAPDPEGLSLEPLSLLRTIFPPFVNPPPSGRPVDPAVSVDPAVYMPLPPSSLLFGDVDLPATEDLLPQFTDEKLLDEELLDEKRLAKSDALRDAKEEQALWAMVDLENPNPNNVAGAADVPEDAEDTAKPAPPRGRPRRKRKRNEVDADADGDANAARDVEIPREKDGDGGSPDERDVERMVEEEAAVADAIAVADVDEPEELAPKRPRKRAAKGEGKSKAAMSQRELMYMQPGVNSRIKSSVYVLDSD